MADFLKKHWVSALIVLLSLTTVVIGIVLFFNTDRNKGFTPSQSEENPEGMVLVSFVTEGSPVQAVTIDKGSTLSDYPVSCLADSSFLGWYTDKECTMPWYLEDPIEENLTVYADFETIEPEFEDYHLNKAYLEDVPTDYRIGIISETDFSEDEFSNRITFTTDFGEEPVLKTVKENGVYYISAEGGFYAGGAYTVKLPEGMRFDEMQDYIDTFSFRIFKDEVQKVELNEHIKYIVSDEITWEPESRDFVASKNIMDKYGISVGDTLCIGDDGESPAGDFLFVNVTEIVEIEENLYMVEVDDCDISDVYNDVDVMVRQELTSEEVKDMIDQTALEKAVYESGCCEDMTMILAAALNSDPTYLKLMYGDNGTATAGSATGKCIPAAAQGGFKFTAEGSDIDQYDFSNNVSFRTDPVTADFDDLLQGVNVSVTTAMVDNKNFTIPEPKNWTAISIKFTYDVTLRAKVKIHAELELVESVNVSAQGYIENKKNLDNLKFDYALNFYTQTDLSGTILVCSTSLENEAKGDDWINITDEISSLMSGEDDSTPDTLVARMKEMLDEKGDYVKLLEVPVVWFKVPVPPVLPVFQVNISVNLVVKVNFAAGLSSKMSVLDATQVGIRGDAKEKKVKGYTNALAEGGRYSYNMAACGYVGLRAGIEGELTLSLVGLDQFGEIGAALEVGAYTDLYGYVDMSVVKQHREGRTSTYVRGGYYMPVGIYGSMSLVAKSSVFKVEADLELLDIQIPLFTLGNKDLLMSLHGGDGTYYMHEDVVNIRNLIPLEGEFLDLTTGEIHTGEIPEGTQFSIQFTNSMFSFNQESGNVMINRDRLDQTHTAETQLYLYYNGSNLIFSKSKTVDGNFAYVGRYTIRWIAPEADIAEEDFGKPVKANYYVETRNERILVGTREVLIGTTPGAWYDLGGMYSVSWDWNISPWKPIYEDTDFVIHGSVRNVLIGYVWLEDGLWKTEVRAMPVGSVPEFPETVALNSKFKGWTVSYGIYVNEDCKPQNGFVVSAAEIPTDCFKYETYINFPVQKNEVLYTGSDFGKFNSWTSFTTFQHMSTSGDKFTSSSVYAVYFAEYDQCEIKINTQYTYGYETRELSSVLYVNSGQRLSIPNSYGVPYCKKLVGWDSDGDSEADFNTVDLPIVTSDMTINAVYESYEINITGMLYDAETGEYTEKVYRVTRGEIIPEEIVNELSNPKVESGLAPRLRYWEITVGDEKLSYDNLIRYTEDNMVIRPVFVNKYTVSFDAGPGYMIGYGKTLTYDTENAIELPEAYLEATDETLLSFATWVDQDGKEYAGGSSVNISRPMTFTARYNPEKRVYKVNVSVTSEKGTLLNGLKNDSYEGDYSGYLTFVAKYDAYNPEAFTDGGYIYNIGIPQKYTIVGDTTTETIITLYWGATPRQFTLTFDAGGGYFFGEKKTATDGAYFNKQYALSSIREIEPISRASDRYSYSLKGWKDSEGNFYDADGIYVVTGDATLTAVWESTLIEHKYRILIENNEIAQGVAAIGERVECSAALKGSAYEGCLIDWSADHGVSVKEDTSGEYVIMSDSDIIISGSVRKFTLTFNAGNGEFLYAGDGKTITDSALHKEAYQLKRVTGLSPIERNGVGYEYWLIGWKSSDGTVYAVNGTYVVEGDAEFTAIWGWNYVETEPADDHVYTYTIYVNGEYICSGTAEAGDRLFYEELLSGTQYFGFLYEWSGSPDTSFGKDDVGGRYAVMPSGDFTLYGTR